MVLIVCLWKEIPPKTAAGNQWVSMHPLITISASHKLFIKTSGTKQQAARLLLGSNLSKMLFGRQNNMKCAEKEREKGLSCKVRTTGDLLVFSGTRFLMFQSLSATHP